MLSIDPKKEKTAFVHQYILGAVAPRPIAFASTIDNDGNINLSPFSFFNAFSANPPILIFSPARRVRGNTIKHTLENVIENKEVVISIPSAEMAEQVSLSSCDFEKEINEFKKAGLTPFGSTIIKPFCVKESPVNFECIVNDIIALGNKGGAGNLVICEIVKIHIQEKILDENNKIDPLKLNALSRLGGNWYGKATKDSLFELKKPIGKIVMGVDQLPEKIRTSPILSGNDLAILASVEEIPFKNPDFEKENILDNEKHKIAKKLLKKGEINEAWQILL